MEEVSIGENPESALDNAVKHSTPFSINRNKNGVLMVMMENYAIKSANFLCSGKIAIGIKYTKDSMEIVEHLAEIGYILFHQRKDTDQHLFAINGICSVVSKEEINEDIYKNIGTTEMYLIVDFDSTNEISSREISSNKKGCNRETRYDAQFATILQLMSD